ncbi:GNAT family N-acetyltransferase [Microbacterium sp. gxy059]|uniref:GNAT family N-acetyltransferase n=1 Tax=Microbacterium sp. gxy059 TaxID=2957199 RepID=UPI003D957F11
MTPIATEPLTPDRWNDVQRVFAGGGDGTSCQCVWPVLRNADFSRTSREEKERLFRDEVEGSVPPGLLVYVDDDPAGWVRVGPRDPQRRLAHTRGLPEASAHPFDDPAIWAITCFSITRDHRREGLMAALLDAAIDHARRRGARVLEAYPRDPSARKTSSNALFVGSLPTFLAAGFEQVAPLGSSRTVVQLAL